MAQIMAQIIPILAVCAIIATFVGDLQAYDSAVPDGRNINLKDLVQHFLLLCGYDYICDISSFQPSDVPVPTETYKLTGVCPSCHCDDDCMSRGDCCPDVYFAVPPMACVNTTLLSVNNSINLEPKSPSYEVVNSCPSGTGNRERQLCEKTYTIKELLTRPPVASTLYSVSYRNKHCARCNGENDTINWVLDIDCILFADFNFLSTYDAIIDLARDRYCRMRYSPMDLPVRPCKITIPEEDFTIRSCNETGTWETFDESIKLACESTYQLQFFEYKNVFCYMCNPPKHMPDDVIDQCNVTGMWNSYDAGLERACVYHTTSQNTRPFKNIFCYLCNRITNDNETFYDVITNVSAITANVSGHIVYNYMIETGQLRPEHVRYTYTVLNNDWRQNDTTSISSGSDGGSSLIVKKKDVNLNVTNLIYKQFAVRPFDQFCDKTIVPLQYVLVYFHTCTCHSICMFPFDGFCCLDFSLTYPVSCMDNYLSRPEVYAMEQFLVTDGCWQNRGHPAIRNRCESDNQTDLIAFLPMATKYDNIYYKNFDCYLCNSYTEEIYPTDYIEDRVVSSYYFLSDIHMKCDSVLDYAHLASFMDVINLSKYINCSVKFVLDQPGIRKVACSTRSKLIDKCNVTGNWPVHDPDVAWACEEATSNSIPEYLQFKNFYCYLCNPENPVVDVISTCNVTGQWQKYNINHEKACHLFPRIYSYPRYKNIFCEVCNSASVPEIIGNQGGGVSDEGEKGPHIPAGPFRLTFRSIFSVAEYDDTPAEMQDRCRKDQLYDYRKDECRNISCFPGKVMNDTNCIPLLSVTNNLRYTMSIEFKGHFNDNQTNALNFLTSMETGIKRHIYKALGTTEFVMDNFHLLSNFPCDSISAYVRTGTINMFLYLTVHIQGYVPRFRTENSLLDNTSDMWIVYVDNDKNISLSAKTSLKAAMTPSVIQKASFKETCYLQRFSSHIFVPLNTFRSVYISKILLCRQIELESDEYDINTLQMELRIHSIGKTLPFDKFQRSSHGRVRVCVEDVDAISDPPTEYVDLALSILTFVCNIVSMICLLLTFIVYLINPTLQSIPGINNMCLVVALFFTQLSFQFGLFASVDSNLCVAIGIILHVLWLTMFGCMVVCSFHMFRVFSGLGRYHAVHSKLKTLKSYITFSFGLPVIIVGLNTTLNLSLSKGQITGYGVDKCFISSRLSFILSFLVPIVTACLSNIVFFSITVYKIRNTPRVDSNQENHRHFGIYVKLFFITGGTWLATVIEAFFPLSIVSYLTTILNGCQGVFIFIGFIMNRRVFLMLKERTKARGSSYIRTSSPEVTRSSAFNMNSSSKDTD
ncbi:uncharacterized protein [Argopecten irradians]|uniref:uncharacterized protein n=1 Tax=Argopecten irradians TaxID=31199 RepID=UPI003716D9C3